MSSGAAVPGIHDVGIWGDILNGVSAWCVMTHIYIYIYRIPLGRVVKASAFGSTRSAVRVLQVALWVSQHRGLSWDHCD